jgi:hypothetical protein
MARRGHQVTVFGVAGSEVDGEVVGTLPGPYGEQDSLEDWHLCEWVNLCQAVQQSGRFDLLHSHAYLWGLPLEPLSEAPTKIEPPTKEPESPKETPGEEIKGPGPNPENDKPVAKPREYVFVSDGPWEPK